MFSFFLLFGFPFFSFLFEMVTPSLYTIHTLLFRNQCFKSFLKFLLWWCDFKMWFLLQFNLITGSRNNSSQLIGIRGISSDYCDSNLYSHHFVLQRKKTLSTSTHSLNNFFLSSLFPPQTHRNIHSFIG